MRTSKQTTSMYRDQQHEKQHKQSSPYCHSLSHPSSNKAPITGSIKPQEKKQESKTLTTTTTHQTTAPLHPSVSTQFLPYIPTFLQLPLVSVTRLHYQKVPTSAIWIPTPPVFASLSASIARNLRLLPVLLQLLVLCRPRPSVT